MLRNPGNREEWANHINALNDEFVAWVDACTPYIVNELPLQMIEYRPDMTQASGIQAAPVNMSTVIGGA